MMPAAMRLIMLEAQKRQRLRLLQKTVMEKSK